MSVLPEAPKSLAKATGLYAEFRSFLLKQNALALAVGVVIGGAIGKVVSAIVDDIFMPVIGLALPNGEWREAQLHLAGKSALKYGDLLGRIVDFTIVAIVVFLVVRLLIREKPAETKVCPECLELVPKAARRCRACTSVFAIAA